MKSDILSSELIIAIYEQHEDEIAEIWGQGEDDDDEDRSMRDSVYMWLRQKLCNEENGT
jgi:hypothetical protein